MAFAAAFPSPWSMLSEGLRDGHRQPWGCHLLVLGLLIYVMVHRHSPAKLALRRAVVAERGFIQPTVDGKLHLLVHSGLKPRLMEMQKGLVVTRMLETAAGVYRKSPMALVRRRAGERIFLDT